MIILRKKENKNMKLFNKKEKKNENKGIGNDIINQLALQESLRELKQEKAINESLEKNMEVLNTTIEKIKLICKESKTSKIAKAILKELGE
jgi:hypothetical protein